ncbi:hypothetical protein D9613_004045 [Agrocybe pediades]|uniref:MYND-type domain-containing protein n=1 Tax=Agrocybe pediades TaxID=84607 RepID=A0A8H4QIG3_9AGAR|nr:hypothetical protein D9613_004045 [Agrocybe pediades]
MDKRYGQEAIDGLGGGGVVSEQSRRNLLRAEDLIRRKRPQQAMPYLARAIQDHHNLDAVIQLAFITPNMETAIQVLQAAERRGREMLKVSLGEDCFDDNKREEGLEFNVVVATRPYMRVLQSLVKCYYDAEQYNKATETVLQMLRLNPSDNMAQRHWAGSLLIRCGRYADALSFSQQWLDFNAVNTGQPPPFGGTNFKTPHRNTMAVKKEKMYAYVAGALLYSAALASFKHFGDCEQARQYLKLAVAANPNIVVKILGEVRQPSSLNNNPRVPNGPEDAQDYLWLSQDLWMETSVWDWANNNPDVKCVVLKNCSRPTCDEKETYVTEFKRCAACHLVSYCSPECQKRDWENHKEACRDRQMLKETIRAIQKGKPPPDDSEYSVYSADTTTGETQRLA